MKNDRYIHDFDQICFHSKENFRQSCQVKLQYAMEHPVTRKEQIIRFLSGLSGFAKNPPVRFAAGFGIFLLICVVTVTSGARLSSYLSTLVSDFTGRYQKNLDGAQNILDIHLENDTCQLTIEDLVVSDHSFILRLTGKIEDREFDPWLLALDGSWKEGNTFFYSHPSMCISTEKKNEYILLFGLDEDIPADAKVSAIEDLAGHEATFRLLDTREAFDAEEDTQLPAFTVQIEHYYKEKEIPVHQELACFDLGSIMVEKVSFNGMFWAVYYEMEVAVRNHVHYDDPFWELDEKGNGYVCMLVASHNGTDYKMSMTPPEASEDETFTYNMTGIDAGEELTELSLYFRKYHMKNGKAPQDSSELSEEHLDIDLTK